MKALVYTGPRTIIWRDEPDPEPGAEDVLVAVKAVGICGSDMHAYLGHDERRPAPLILGHEVAGTIVSGNEQGRRVTINPLVTCRHCEECRTGRNNLCAKRQIISMPRRPGGFADYVSIPPGNLVTVPDDYSLEQAALAEPLACGWHAVRVALQAIGGKSDDRVRCLVIGGGAIGLAAALSLKAASVGEVAIAETNAHRHPALVQAGDFEVFDPAETNPFVDRQADIVIDAVGHATTRDISCRCVRPGGVIVHIGLAEATGGLDVRRLTLQEITFIGTYTYTADDFRETASAMLEGRLGALDWFETRPLADGPQAFADILSGRVAAPKIILRP